MFQYLLLEIKEKGKKISIKIRWSDEERRAVLSSFSTAIKNMKLPSFKEINEVKLKYPTLKNRTTAQIMDT